MKRRQNKLTAYALLFIVVILLYLILRPGSENADLSGDEELQSVSEADFSELEDTLSSLQETDAEEITEPVRENRDLAKDGVYSSKEDVSLYIHIYGELPDNYITKKEAKALGWEGGSLEEVAPGKAIGGDHFGNYEGLLPEEGNYTECDIDTLGKSSRGAKRIVFDTGGNIYYTEDHYASFTQLYDENGPKE